MTKLFLASTMFGATTLSAAIDEGLFGPHDEPRVLLTWNNAIAAEVHPSLEQRPGFDTVRGRFDYVRSWNNLIAPLHPAGWRPGSAEIPLLSRLIKTDLGIQDDISELIVESLGAETAQTFAWLFRDCPITVYSDGLMAYGPTRNYLPRDFGGRITRLLHLPLVPKLNPLLLREFKVEYQPIEPARFMAVVHELPPSKNLELPRGAALMIGQYLSALDVLSVAEEATMNSEILEGLAAGHGDVIFKPHPAAGNAQSRRLLEQAHRLGVQMHVAPADEPLEVILRDFEPSLVAGAFSTGLSIAEQFFHCPVATSGGALVLERLTPFQNSNRIPATIVDASMPHLHLDGTIQDPPYVPVDSLVEAVGYCMQSENLPELRDVAVRHLAEWGRGRYFKKKRLEALGLIAKPAPKPAAAAAPPARGRTTPSPGARLAPLSRRAETLRAAALERMKRRGSV